VARVHHGGYLILQAPAAEIADTALKEQQLAFYLKEPDNQLMIKVKRSNGAVSTAVLGLTG